MTIIKSKHYKIYTIVLLLILSNCQLQDPKKTHGINFLDNKIKVLEVNKTNKNDVYDLIGQPHTVSVEDVDTWYYFQRTITKGKLHKLGQNVLKDNNIIALEFNKYGVLTNKTLYDKNDMKKVSFSKRETENEISQQSFVSKFLSSIKQKMYGKNKF
jgi:outer membrane protein assembly factor BamE (lipoprotein component of BamABCDE complex)